MAEEKLKILYLMKLLLEETDEEHLLNAVQLCEILEKRYALPCTRKTIYADIERLRSFGLKIGQVKGDVQGYYIQERSFSLPELKLLVDAVQSSKFITKKKSDLLIQKLEKQTSRENAKQLQRHVFIFNRTKAENEAIFQTVDRIHSAIALNHAVSFQYCEWTIQKKLVPRKNGKRYEVSPHSLTWADENYYLVAYEEESGKIKHYRVDKMKDMQILEKERKGKEAFAGFDLAAYSKKTFGMFGGRDVTVTLRCSNLLAGVVLDRFGREIMMIPDGEGHFRTHVTVAVSPQFFGWLTGIGEQMELAGPAGVCREYEAYLENLWMHYQNKKKQ